MAHHYWLWHEGRPVQNGTVSLRRPAERIEEPTLLAAIEHQTGCVLSAVGIGGTVDAVGGWSLLRDFYGDHSRGAAERLGWAKAPKGA